MQSRKNGLWVVAIVTITICLVLGIYCGNAMIPFYMKYEHIGDLGWVRKADPEAIREFQRHQAERRTRLPDATK